MNKDQQKQEEEEEEHEEEEQEEQEEEGGKECSEGGERSDGMRGNAAAFRTTQNIFGRFSKSHYVEDCRRNIDAASKAIVPYRPSRSPR